MDDGRCLKHEAELAAIARIARDPLRRRELLWLRFKEVDDEECVQDLERDDPALAARMCDVLSELETSGIESPRERRAWFGRKFDACHDRHVRDLVPYSCACARCVLCREC